jgi:hypothetical protein
VGKLPEKLKSHDYDQAEHSSCGGYWRGVRMQRNGEYSMHKKHRYYKNVEERRDMLLFVVVVFVVVVDDGVVAVVVFVESDSCVKKEESAATEIDRRGILH